MLLQQGQLQHLTGTENHKWKRGLKIHSASDEVRLRIESLEETSRLCQKEFPANT